MNKPFQDFIYTHFYMKCPKCGLFQWVHFDTNPICRECVKKQHFVSLIRVSDSLFINEIKCMLKERKSKRK